MRKMKGTAVIGLVIGIIIVIALAVGSIAVFTMKLRAHFGWGTAVSVLAGIGIYSALGGIGFAIGKAVSDGDTFTGNLLVNICPVVCAVIAWFAL